MVSMPARRMRYEIEPMKLGNMREHGVRSMSRVCCATTRRRWRRIAGPIASPSAAEASDAGGTAVDERDFEGRGHGPSLASRASFRASEKPCPRPSKSRSSTAVPPASEASAALGDRPWYTVRRRLAGNRCAILAPRRER